MCYIITSCRFSLPILLRAPYLVVGFHQLRSALLPRQAIVCSKRRLYLSADASSSSRRDSEIEYTTMSPKDVPKLAKMLSDNFDGPYSWWQKPYEVYNIWTTECQLIDRFEKFLIRKERNHLMLVARSEGVIVGKFTLNL
jgi:hypothetical protein